MRPLGLPCALVSLKLCDYWYFTAARLTTRGAGASATSDRCRGQRGGSRFYRGAFTLTPFRHKRAILKLMPSSIRSVSSCIDRFCRQSLTATAIGLEPVADLKMHSWPYSDYRVSSLKYGVFGAVKLEEGSWPHNSNRVDLRPGFMAAMAGQTHAGVACERRHVVSRNRDLDGAFCEPEPLLSFKAHAPIGERRAMASITEAATRDAFAFKQLHGGAELIRSPATEQAHRTLKQWRILFGRRSPC